MGRSERNGSGVGVRFVLSEERSALFSGMVFTVHAPWTFLTTSLSFFRGQRQLDPEEIERFWNTLLSASIPRRRPALPASPDQDRRRSGGARLDPQRWEQQEPPERQEQ